MLRQLHEARGWSLPRLEEAWAELQWPDFGRLGRLEAARQRLAESTRLRRETGLLAGAAPNMVGLAYIAAAQHRNDDALALLDEAAAIARASQAHRILQQGSEARTDVSDQHSRRPA
jgi:hypothetical protein